MKLSLVMAEENVPPSCVACRRRLRANGKPVFTRCTCLQFGRGVTVATLGLASLALGVLAVRVARTRR